MKSNRITLPVASLIAAVQAGAAVAADASGCYGAYYTSFESIQIADNHLVLIANAFGTGYATSDPSSPMKGAAGPCLIFNEVIDGVPKGMGRCVRTDADGDKFLVIGTVDSFTENGGTAGTWRIEGLTGKWIGAVGSGTYADAGGSDSQHYFLCFEGTVEMASQ